MQQSLSPLIVPKLSKIFTDSKERFLHSAKSELLQVFSITISACFIGCGLWYFAGGYLVGYDRWQKIGDIFYLAIAVEFTLAISNIFNMCVLLPSRSLSGLALPTILFRVLTIPLMFFLDPVVQDDVKLVFYVMSVTGIMVFIAYAIKSFFTLYEINKSI